MTAALSLAKNTTTKSTRETTPQTLTSKLQNLGGQVLKNGGAVHGSGGTDSAIVGGPLLQETVDTTDGELRSRNEQHEPCKGASEMMQRCIIAGNRLLNYDLASKAAAEMLERSEARKGTRCTQAKRQCNAPEGRLS